MSLHSAVAKTQAAQALGNALNSTLIPKVDLSRFLSLFAFFLLPLVSSCNLLPNEQAEAQQSRPPKTQQPENRPTPVDVLVARTGLLKEELQYIGTTRPAREVSLRAQVEGRLLSLQVDVGDAVTRGQILAQLDDALLLTGVTQAQAELAARQSEVASAKTQIANAKAQVEQRKAELQQAQRDAIRLNQLATAGAISQQEAELAETESRTAFQVLRAAEEEVRNREEAVTAALGRVAAQQAVVAQNRERQSYAVLTSPITGVVLEKVSEPGNLIQPGGEVLRLGDFSRVKVVVPVSELALSEIRAGQSVKVQLDAFGNEQFFGEVARISPSADVSARQIPVEITIANSNGKIGSGLLARVSFATTTAERVIVPQTALQVAGAEKRRGEGARGRGGESSASSQSSIQNPQSNTQNSESAEAKLFVVTGQGKQAKVKARSVKLGEQVDGKVEILSGLKAGERFVSRSGKPLKDGETVRLSILSITSNQSAEKR